jgi:uncharacterized membrane protein
MKKLCLLILCVLMTQMGAAADVRVLYDDVHGQTAGNADWLITGAYSEFAGTLKSNGFIIENLSKVSENGQFSEEVLGNYRGLILAEPNNPYADAEGKAIVEFARNGGGVFIIGDHINADRNGNGWDAVRIFNTFCENFGFKFASTTFYDAPVGCKANKNHPVMSGVRAVGAWAAGTFEMVEAADAKVVSLLDSKYKKQPYIVASEFARGRIVAIGDSSPFDDGVGSDQKSKLHDSYDSFMYSHPQFGYNAMAWVVGIAPEKHISSRKVAYYNEAKPEEKNINILVDAANVNAASDKMKTFEKHMNKNGLKVYFTLDLIQPEMLENFATVLLPDPSLQYESGEASAVAEWFMRGGNLIMGCAWDSSRVRGTRNLNFILDKIGAVMRFNDDQVWDHTNKTNKPWGVIANQIKKDHPVTKGVKQVITWGTCSLIDRNNQPLTEKAGVEILVTGDDDTFNKDGHTKYPAVIYPENMPIPIMAMEEVANGRLALIGCCNFTDYQYPDSDINASLGGNPPFTHETPTLYNNLLKHLSQKK